MLCFLPDKSIRKNGILFKQLLSLSYTNVHEQEIKRESKFLSKDRISSSNLQKKKKEGRIRPKRESGVLTT